MNGNRCPDCGVWMPPPDPIDAASIPYCNECLRKKFGSQNPEVADTDLQSEGTEDVDWKNFAGDLLDLLDLVETNQDATYRIVRICKMRFDLAERYGMTVEFGEPASSTTQ